MRPSPSNPADLDGDEPEFDSELDFPAQPQLVRLNKYLADQGIASRRKCDEMITKGKISIDGEPATELGRKIDPYVARVEVDGVILKPDVTRRRYYLLNKPRGVICTNERREARTRAIDLITDRNKGRIYTVGRLDEDSSGLLLLTNDGEFANRIAHPRHGVPKTYRVKVRGRMETEAIEQIESGVRLSEGRTTGAIVRVDKRSNDFTTLDITIREGKNREVRRIFAAVGFKVLRLQRTRIGTLTDRRLKEGDWRPLLSEELIELEALTNDPRRSEELMARASRAPMRSRGRSSDRGRSRSAPTGPKRDHRGRRGSIEPIREGRDRRGSAQPARVQRDAHPNYRDSAASRGPRNPDWRERPQSERSGAARVYSAKRRTEAGSDRVARPGASDRNGGRGKRPDSSLQGRPSRGRSAESRGGFRARSNAR